MKFVFSLLIVFAVSAITADIVLKFVDSSEVLASGENSNEDGDPDDQQEDDSKDDSKDDEQQKTKEFYWISFEQVSESFTASVKTSMNTHIAIFIDHPLQSTPFSPPELA